MAAKGKYAANADVANVAEVVRLHQGVAHAMVKELLEVVVEMHLGKSDLILAKRAAVVAEANGDTRSPVPDVLEMERSTYGKHVPLVADVVLLRVANKRRAPYATAKVISSVSVATGEVSPTDRKRVKSCKLPTTKRKLQMQQMDRMLIGATADVEDGEVRRYENELYACFNRKTHQGNRHNCLYRTRHDPNFFC